VQADNSFFDDVRVNTAKMRDYLMGVTGSDTMLRSAGGERGMSAGEALLALLTGGARGVGQQQPQQQQQQQQRPGRVATGRALCCRL
jgi:hypothetical protein